jgi:hypothetical protein
MSRVNNEVAKQLATYADAIAAFSFAESIVFCLALGSTEFVCHMKMAGLGVYGAIGVSSALYVVLVIACHAGEDRLIDKLPRDDSPWNSAKRWSSADQWTRVIRVSRIGLVIVSAFLACAALCLSTHSISPKCP